MALLIKTLVTTGLLWVATLVNAAPQFDKPCRQIPERSPEDAVAIICDDNSAYNFTIAGEVLIFDKTEFKTRLRESLSDWWQSQGESLDSLSHASIAVWLSIPEANPGAAQARAVVQSNRGNMSLSFDLRSHDWTFTEDLAAVTGIKTYPETYGWRPRQLLIGAAKTADPTQLAQFLLGLGVTLGEEASGGWYQATTEFLDEQTAAQRIRAADKNGDYIRSVQLNTLMEWIAHRGLAVEFPWQESPAKD